jgi:hypothetical protein
MAKIYINHQLTYAAPTAAVALTLADSTYSKVAGVRLVADNDNASASVQVQAVVSRAADPLAVGGLAASKAIERGDAVVAAETMAAGRSMLVAELSPEDAIIDETQLLSGAAGAYLGLRAVGLESGKVANVQVVLDVAEVPKSQANTGVYLDQVVRFQDV